MKKIPAVLLIIVLIILIEGCDKNEIKSFDNPSASSEMTMEGFSLVETNLGKKTLTLDAKTAKIDQINKKIRAFDIKLQNYDEKGEMISVLTANEGIVSMDNYDMEASGNVLVVTNDGAKLETSKLKREAKTNMIVSGVDVYVKVTMGDNILEGYGLETDAKLENVKITKVKTTLKDVNQLQGKEKDEKKGRN